MPTAGEPSHRPPTPLAAQRIARAVREQLELVPQSLDDRIPFEHPARAIWALLEQLDLTAFYTRIRAALDGPGRPASDPRVLLGLWLLATVEGIGSARRLARLCTEHDAYRWLRGGVPVNYHLLADFRVSHQAELDDLLTQSIAALLAANLVTLQRVAQDGVRVRASAGASSFRRRASLQRCQQEAQAQVQRCTAEREAPDPTVSAKAQAARERAAREQQERLEQALAALPALEAIKEQQRKKLSKRRREKVGEARVSTTDPDARVMKVADGGFRPSYNVQVVTDAASRAIVAVAVSQQGSDGGLVPPLLEQTVQRTGCQPEQYLIDGGLTTRETVTLLAQQGITVYGPVEPPRTETSGRTRYQPRPDDTPEVVAWRQRMGTEQGQSIYRQRSGLAEWTNAQLRDRLGLQRFTVRGLARVTSVVLLLAVTQNLLRLQALTV